MTDRRQFARMLLGATAGVWVKGVQAQQMHGPNVAVQGLVVSRTKGPIPGVSVSLVHRIFGRSAIAFTDMYGRFGWSAIPVSPEPYYLELHWGSNLLYRQPIRVEAPLDLPKIVL